MNLFAIGARCAVIGLAAVTFQGVAQAQDKAVELRFAHWLPATHPLAKLGFEPWAKSVETASNGSIKVTLYPAQQLGKAADHYDMSRDGIADLTWANPGYQAGRFPLFGAGELPFLMAKPGPASAALDQWYRKYAAQEMKDVKFCLAHLHIGTLHSKKPISEPSQLKGMKIRASNGTAATYMTALGATNVQVSAPESRDALEKGVADAILFPWHSIITFGIDKVAKYHAGMRMYSSDFAWTMNRAFYDKLSTGQKKVIDDHCNNEWAAKIGTAWGDDEDSGQDKLARTAGHTVTPISPQQLEAWKKSAEPVYERWLADVAKSGVDGKQALAELRKELEARKGGQ
ncbi:MAG: TRAP transporter substrate-binding protein [Burkholderiales bacterium]|nr:TRAP transporter substrate-binding protein [Burkholderiales bacterium]MBK8666677.1 TRAP transporter substrate-binding protein [Burkholderiales bacterium]